MAASRKDALGSIAHRISHPSHNVSESQDASKDFSMPRNETDAMAMYSTVEKLRMARWLIALMFVGYGVPTALAILAGWKIWGFHLDISVHVAMAVSMTTAVTYVMRNVLSSIFPTT